VTGPLAAVAVCAMSLLLVAGCGGPAADDDHVSGPPIVTRPIGVGPGFLLPPRGPSARGATLVRGLSCGSGRLTGPVVAHLEIFARRDTLVIPAGIGVLAGRCRYPVRTLMPTGLIVASRVGLTLGDLFAVWGQPLGARRLAGFHGRVEVFVAGRKVRGDVRAIPIRHHSQIVVEVSGYVPPHAHYVFPRSS
jgi:hypothetical protein